MAKGYVKLYRKVSHKPYWPGNERRKFTKFEAWIDIVMNLAAGKDNGSLRRGQFRASLSFLAARWSWGRTTVHRFLAQRQADGELQRVEQQAEQKAEQQAEHLTVTNYNTLNPMAEQQEEQSAEQQAEPIKRKRKERERKGEREECRERIQIPLKDGSCYAPEPNALRAWARAYPSLDVRAELLKAAVWCDNNPARRKTRAGVKRFVNAWLNRATPEPDMRAREREIEAIEQQLRQRGEI